MLRRGRAVGRAKRGIPGAVQSLWKKRQTIRPRRDVRQRLCGFDWASARDGKAPAGGRCRGPRRIATSPTTRAAASIESCSSAAVATIDPEARAAADHPRRRARVVPERPLSDHGGGNILLQPHGRLMSSVTLNPRSEKIQRRGGRRGLSKTLARWCLMLGAVPGLLHAQIIRGTVSSAVGAGRVPGAVILLLDSSLTTRARALTSDSGTFAIGALAPGRFHLKVMRIGFRPTESRVFDLARDTTIDVALTDIPVVLPAVSTRDRNDCRLHPDTTQAGLLTFALWEQAHTAFLAAAISGDDGTVRAFAVAAAIGVVAGRREVRRIARIGQRRLYADARHRMHPRREADAGRRGPRHCGRSNVGIDPRPQIRTDGRHPRLDTQIGRAHDALRVGRRG